MTVAHRPRAKGLALPEAVRALLPMPGRLRIRWTYSASIVAMHLLVLLACLPWLFSWTGLIACCAGLYVFGTLGVNVGFHRLLTHRSFVCSKFVEKALAILGVCCLQEGPDSFKSLANSCRTLFMAFMLVH